MNGNTGQYSGYYNQIPPGAKPYPGPGRTVAVMPNGHWPEQNGHNKMPYSMMPQQNASNAPGQMPQNFVSPGNGSHPNQPVHHLPSHFVRGPQLPPSSNGPYLPPQRSFAPNSAPGESPRYPPPSNGSYSPYDPNLRKPSPNQMNSSYPPGHPLYPRAPSPASPAQSPMGQRFYIEPMKAYKLHSVDVQRPRFMTPNFPSSGAVPEPVRPPLQSSAFNNANSTPKKAPETLNDLLRKPINDNNRHLRQVLTSNIPQPPSAPTLPAGTVRPTFGSPSPVTIVPPPNPPPPTISSPAPLPTTPKARATKNSKQTPKSSVVQAVSLPVPKLDIIEATKPKLMAPKMLKIGSDVNMKKVILSLKSGLLAESKWAIDCLLVLSNSPKSIRILPSLMLALLEHYKCNLNAIFDDLLDQEISLEELSTIGIENTNYEEISIETFPDVETEFIKQNGDCQTKMNAIITNGTTVNGDVESEKIDEQINENSNDDTANSFDSNTGLPIIYKHDPNIPKLKRKIKNGYDNDCLNDKKICDRRKLRDVDSLDTSHITLNFDLEQNDNDNNNNETATKFSIKNSDQTIEYDDKYYKNEHYKEAEMANIEKLSVFCARKDKVDRLIIRCLNISNIFYNISFCKDNHSSLLSQPSLLTILSRILLYKHEHKHYPDFGQIEDANYKRKLEDGKENFEELFSDFPYDMLIILRQNSFGIISNLAEDMNLCEYSDKIVLSLVDALLHWSVCKATIAKDPQKPDNISFQLSALEILVKLTMKDSNVDLIIATPPFSRIELLYGILVDSLSCDENPVVRELSLVILSNLTQNDNIGARIVLYQKYSISNIIRFIEQYEMAKHPQFPVTPNTMNSHYMVRRACQFLLRLSNVCIKDEVHFIRKYEERIRNLALSQLLDDDISKIVADLMFRISK